MTNNQIKIIEEKSNVKENLKQLDLKPNELLEIRNRAIGARSEATLSHPSNAPGTLAYQEGVRSLRDVISSKEWIKGKYKNIEIIRNDKQKIMIGYSNVDKASNKEYIPQAISKKGPGAESACQGNLFKNDIDFIYPIEEYQMYYLMVDSKGAVELSCPIIQDEKYVSYSKRIFISDGSDIRDTDTLLFNTNEAAKEFDPSVVRK